MIYGDNVHEEKCEWGMLIIIEKKIAQMPWKISLHMPTVILYKVGQIVV